MLKWHHSGSPIKKLKLVCDAASLNSHLLTEEYEITQIFNSSNAFTYNYLLIKASLPKLWLGNLQRMFEK